MSQEVTLETLFAAGPFLIVAALLSSLVPALVMKWLMSRLFGEQVSYLLLLFVCVCTVLLTMGAMFGLGFIDLLQGDNPPLGPVLLLVFAGYALQLAMLTLFATNSDMEIIAMWKWLVVLIAQALLYLFFSFLLGLMFGLALATV